MNLFLSALVVAKISLALLLILICESELNALKERGQLMLCLKEIKGETHQFIELVEKINWGIRNTDKVKYLAIIFPALAPVAASSEKAKKVMMETQNLLLAKYLYKLTQLSRRCRSSPQTFLTPYQITIRGFKRNLEGITIWRKKWDIKFNSSKETATIKLFPKTIRSLKPHIQYQYSIKRATPWSAFPFSWVFSS